MGLQLRHRLLEVERLGVLQEDMEHRRVRLLDRVLEGEFDLLHCV